MARRKAASIDHDDDNDDHGDDNDDDNGNNDDNNKNKYMDEDSGGEGEDGFPMGFLWVSHGFPVGFPLVFFGLLERQALIMMIQRTIQRGKKGRVKRPAQATQWAAQ